MLREFESVTSVNNVFEKTQYNHISHGFSIFREMRGLDRDMARRRRIWVCQPRLVVSMKSLYWHMYLASTRSPI